jgi:CheY-like chemotaxis protein
VTLPQKIHSPEKLAAVIDADEKAVIIYERREIYADSILYAINNLGVRCEIVSSDAQFCELLEGKEFSHIFISHALFEKNRENILKHGTNLQIIMLVEFGGSIPAGNWGVLSMPVHTISTANILNGISESFSYNTREELVARFTASGAKVLIVDDIKTNLKVAHGLLLPYKMDVDLCNSGAEAIEAVKAKNYDIVFMDHRMPGMDGVEATAHIRALGTGDQRFKNLPIVALTANAISGMREMFLENGFDDYLTKPVDVVKLNVVLEKWVPKEKRASPAVEIPKNDIEEAPYLAINGIDGLDVSKGIISTGGTIEFYCETLAVFFEDGLEKQRELVDCLETEELLLFTTHIHALKSALANIGAIALSDMAYTLEEAGIKGDLPYVKSNIDHFLQALGQLLNSINNALQTIAGNAKEEGLTVGHIKDDLRTLKRALEDMNIAEINTTVNALLKSTQASSAISTVRNISKHILMFEYEEAEQLIESLLQAD